MATRTKADQKPVCKYGAECYRKSQEHLKQYRHPKSKHDNDEEDTPKKKKKEPAKTVTPKHATITDYFKRDQKACTEAGLSKKKTKDVAQNKKGKHPSDEEKEAEIASAIDVDEEKKEDKSARDVDEEKEDETASDVEDSEHMPDSPTDMQSSIKNKFLVKMPTDFYDFWKLCQKINPEDPLDALQETLGFTLVGPYDVVAGRHKDVEKNSAGRQPNFLLHWRYYYDPPEFLTVIKGDDEKQFHIGYFRDDPSEMPIFVATNCAKENGVLTPVGDNLFAAVNHSIIARLKSTGLAKDKKESLQKLQEQLKTAALTGDYALELETKQMKERNKKSVCKTFHGAGMVVPVDANEVGYRPVPETPGNLKKMLARIRDSKTEKEKDKNLEPLQELITLVQFANDECDYGEGLELGLDLFTFGGECFHSMIGSLLSLAYQLLGRPEFSKIIEAHLSRRLHSANLSEID